MVAFALALVGCGDDETQPPGSNPVVTIDGGYSLDIGETLTLSATTTDGADSAYAWVSSRNDVATVNEAGVVTAVAAGETIITATGADTGVSAEHGVVVLPQATGTTPYVTVSGNPVVLVGGAEAMMATTHNADDASYSWMSSDEAVATVDDTGLVTGLKVGEVIITATGSDTAASGTVQIAVVQESPNYDKWLSSGHADATAEAFNHWNEDDPAEVPTSCAKCHSTPGFQDWIGADGSAVNSVEAAVPVGSVIHCGACHNEAASEIEEVLFPSGEIVDHVGKEAVCMNCHQGRSSKDDVDQAILDAGSPGEDTPDMNLGFLNIHYYSAAATLNAGRVRGGYQYDTEVYDWRFRHVPGYDSCVGCHDPHSLEVKVDKCAGCHQGVTTVDDLKDIRMIVSKGEDYDGDGDTNEGIYHEIETLKMLLVTAIQTYTVEEGFGDICYDELAYPYWFNDTNQNGVCDGDEAQFANSWKTWTPRLMKAAYNFQVSNKDPGGFAHNAKYLIQLVYDSISDIDGVLTTPVLPMTAVRNDPGHFNGASEAARHWDEDEEVSQSCSKCHGGSDGFHFYLQYGVGTTVVEPDNGLDCATCHTSFGTTYDLVTVNSVTFPGGTTLSDPGNPSNICMTCHAGRVGKADIDAAIAANKFSFQNVHYLPAGAVKKGTAAKVGYEYPSKTYAGEWTFHGQCVNCHDAGNTLHSFHPNDNMLCTNGCHAPTPLLQIRTQHLADYDGDNDNTETLHDELAGLAAAVLSAMNASATPGPCYAETSYPYFFKDNNNSGGDCDPSEAVSSNRFTAWNAGLMKAAHNYQIFRKEPGSWAHNFDYMGQLLYDSAEDLGANVSSFTRP
ncbi:MAG: Ig-like domain-containing protein [Polyangiaceae bacterium]